MKTINFNKNYKFYTVKKNNTGPPITVSPEYHATFLFPFVGTL